ncbi:heterochromatin protein, putative [Pediculus humanus corporis]|uniref:Histone-lysine N-methyltransferase n=1 Tax=Pediculus humanus subsp. corporis TaxID=121224 RepID=E0VSV0_PEDHC|nr:heterochromatin protein, putative [Pediculus humanus corporis]EEB16456.1 heterochromatin protein, putative [Pediculus humanus corporis]
MAGNEEDSEKDDYVTWDTDQEYEVEKILGHRRNKKNQFTYLVKWKGWSDAFNSFEPLENLTGCNYLLMKYYRKFRSTTNHTIEDVRKRVQEGVETYEVYQKLMRDNFSRESIDEFSRDHVNVVERIFGTETDFEECEKFIGEEYKYLLEAMTSATSSSSSVDVDDKLCRRVFDYDICLRLISRRRKQLRELATSEAKMNNFEDVGVKIENHVDLDSFPNFVYVTKLQCADDVVFPADPPLGCDCSSGCSKDSTSCCGRLAGFQLAYNSNKRLRIPEREPIYECNKKCSCSSNCVNRVVQSGRQVELCVFKTPDKGWGVKNLNDRILKGTFVCEYIGEVIPQFEAAKRDVENEKKKVSYLFDLDFNPDHESEMYSIDTYKYGNVARFINHSCEPNLVVYPVWIDCLEPNLPRLAFFAKRNIGRNEEITFDYCCRTEDGNGSIVDADDEQEENGKLNNGKKTMSKIRCECKASNCRGWLFK